MDAEAARRCDAMSVNQCRDGCAGGDAAMCVVLGRAYMSGTRVTSDWSTATALFERGCDGGQLMGCYMLASMNQVAAPAKAFPPYKKCCEAGMMAACGLLVSMSDRAKGVVPKSELVPILRKLCVAVKARAAVAVSDACGRLRDLGEPEAESGT
jgi:TPR repeat protein